MLRAIQALHTLQRYPSLGRALRFGVALDLNGVAVRANPLLVGDRVIMPVQAQGTFPTRFGSIDVHGSVEVSCDLETFAGILDEADRRGVLPRVQSFLLGETYGRPILPR